MSVVGLWQGRLAPVVGTLFDLDGVLLQRGSSRVRAHVDLDRLPLGERRRCELEILQFKLHDFILGCTPPGHGTTHLRLIRIYVRPVAQSEARLPAGQTFVVSIELVVLVQTLHRSWLVAWARGRGGEVFKTWSPYLAYRWSRSRPPPSSNIFGTGVYIYDSACTHLSRHNGTI